MYASFLAVPAPPVPPVAPSIALPRAELTLVDAVKKKTFALRKISEVLEIESQVNIKTERIEITGRNPSHREKYDLAMARAVAAAPIAAEYLIPLIKTGGEGLLYRGNWSKDDSKILSNARKLLKAEISQIEQIKLPANLIFHLTQIGC